MKKLLLIIFPAIYGIANAQRAWTQKASLTGSARLWATGFTIGTKGYIGVGGDFASNHYLDFWEWDQPSNTWTQKANFPGTDRSEAVGFSVGTKGYVATGFDGTVQLTDLWEWDQTNNTWTKKPNLSGGARDQAAGFSIGTKGYIGTGYKSAAPNYLKDFWEWNPSTGGWYPQTTLSMTRAGASSFSIGTKGYFGTGHNGTNALQDFWEWNQSSGAWTQKATFIGAAREHAIGFSIGTRGYIGTGANSTTKYKDFWEWDQASNTWAQKTDFGGTARHSAIGFSVGTKGYIGTGYDGTEQNDFWEYDPSFDITCISYLSSNFSASTDTVIQYDTINFTNTSFNATSYSWLINGNQFSTSANTSSTFGSLGTYTITLITVNSHCGDTSKMNMTIVVIPCPDWYQKANFGAGPSYAARGFSIGTYGYIGGINYQSTSYQDLWEWNSVTNTWAQKASFSNGKRNFPVGFSIGTKGYIGTGGDISSGMRNDFWEWNQTNNTWTQKANFGGTPRQEAVGFSIGTKGYIGTGGDKDSLRSDFWEWNQATNTWTQKANFPANARHDAVGFSIGTKGYIGTGEYWNGSTYVRTKDFWEWDQTTNVWTQKTNFAGTQRRMAVGFSIGGKGYISTGLSLNISPYYYNDFWEFDPSANSWAKKADIPRSPGYGGVGFSIGSKGYIGTGWTLAAGNSQDFWEYSPCSVAMSSTISSVNPSCFGQCNGTATVTPSSGTPPYKYLWSNLATTQAISGLCSGTFSVTVTDVVNITASAVVTLTQPTLLTNSLSIVSPICGNSNGSVTAVVGGATQPYTYLWNNGKTTASVTGLTGSPTQTMIVTITDAKGCTRNDTAIVQCVTGIENYNWQSQIILSPNPTNGIIFIYSPEKIVHIEIMNVLGEKIYSPQINANKSEIDFSKQEEGIYFLQIKTSLGIANKKIILSK